jgi:hypothetical protein
MSNKIDKNTIKNGRLIKVWNTEKPKFTNANETYIAIWVEDANGKNERCLLFTESAIKIAEARASKNQEDLTKKNLIVNFLD